MKDKVRFAIRVDGKVQGVWFRQTTKDKAEELGLTGTVENLEDGSVYIEAEGSEDDLGKLLMFCTTGSQNAEVKGVTLVKVPIIGYQGFSIKR